MDSYRFPASFRHPDRQLIKGLLRAAREQTDDPPSSAVTDSRRVEEVSSDAADPRGMESLIQQNFGG